MAEGSPGVEEKGALLCILPESHLKTVSEILLKEGYNISFASLPHDAIKKLQTGYFQVVIIEESFIKNDDSLTTYLENMPMDLRRKIVLILIGRELITGDRLLAYLRSANLVVNIEDIDSLGKLLNGALEDHKRLYRTFGDTLREIGR